MDTLPPQNAIDQFWSIYPHLPKELQKALFSEETAKDIQGLIVKYGLDDQPTSLLANIVGDVFLGLLHPNQVKARLIQDYNLPEDVAESLNNDLNTLLFQPLQGSLNKLSYLHNTVAPAGPLKDIYGEPV